MSQASAPAGGDPLGLPDAVTEGAGLADPEGSAGSPASGEDARPHPGSEPTDGVGAAGEEPADGNGPPGEEPAVEALGRVTQDDPASGSDPMPDIAGSS